MLPQELRHTIFYESNRLLNEVMFSVKERKFTRTPGKGAPIALPFGNRIIIQSFHFHRAYHPFTPGINQEKNLTFAICSQLFFFSFISYPVPLFYQCIYQW